LGISKNKQDCEVKHVLSFTDTNRKTLRNDVESESKQREGKDEYILDRQVDRRINR